VKFRSVDQAAIAYLALTETLSSVRAMNPGERVQKPRAGACRHCRHKKHQWSEGRRSAGRWTCAACGKRWPVDRIIDAGNGTRRLTRPPMEAQRDLCMDLGTAFAPLPDSVAIVWWMYTRLRREKRARDCILRLFCAARGIDVAGVRTHELVADACGISGYAVREMLSRARGIAEPRLERKGLLAGG